MPGLLGQWGKGDTYLLCGSAQQNVEAFQHGIGLNFGPLSVAHPQCTAQGQSQSSIRGKGSGRRKSVCPHWEPGSANRKMLSVPCSVLDVLPQHCQSAHTLGPRHSTRLSVQLQCTLKAWCLCQVNALSSQTQWHQSKGRVKTTIMMAK